MNRRLIAIVILLFLIGITLAVVFIRSERDNKHIDVYDVVRQAFLTETGYTDEISKHMLSLMMSRNRVQKKQFYLTLIRLVLKPC